MKKLQRITQGFEFEDPLGLETYKIEPSEIRFNDGQAIIGQVRYNVRDRRKLSLMLYGEDVSFKHMEENLPTRTAPILVTIHNDELLTRVSSVNYRPFNQDELHTVLVQSATEPIYVKQYSVGGLPYVNAAYQMGSEVKIGGERFSPMVWFSNHNTGGTSLRYGAGLVVSVCSNGMIVWYTGMETARLNVRTVHVAANIQQAAQAIIEATFDTIEDSTMLVKKLVSSTLDFEVFSEYVKDLYGVSKKVISLIDPSGDNPRAFDLIQNITKLITHSIVSRNMYSQLMKLSQELQASALRIDSYTVPYLLSAP